MPARGAVDGGDDEPVVHLVCGLNGAGKTTHARVLEGEGAVRFTLDEWMIALWPGLRFDDDGWPDRAERCREVIWSAAQQVLARGVDVVLDWNLWDAERRSRWSGLVGSSGYQCVLHHVVADTATAVRRAVARDPAGAYALTAGEVEHLAKLFVPPTDHEGLRVVRVESATGSAAPP